MRLKTAILENSEELFKHSFGSSMERHSKTQNLSKFFGETMVIITRIVNLMLFILTSEEITGNAK